MSYMGWPPKYVYNLDGILGYIGAAPNQQIVPAIEYMNENYGKKVFLLGSDYVFPRTANSIVKKQAESLGMEVVGEEYTPMGHTDYTTILSKIKQAEPDFIFNTLNGDSNVAFFKQFKDAGLTPEQIQTLSQRKRQRVSEPPIWRAISRHGIIIRPPIHRRTRNLWKHTKRNTARTV